MARRDIAMITDGELRVIRNSVLREISESNGVITAVFIESDYPDRDNIKYVVTTEVTRHLTDDDPADEDPGT